jgi:hypothetical protein
VICGTGYTTDLLPFPKEVYETIRFTNPHDGTTKVALYKYTLCPEWQDLAFAGKFNVYGAHSLTAEMQAHYISMIFKGNLPRPKKAKIHAGVERFKSFHLGGRTASALPPWLQKILEMSSELLRLHF